MLGGRFAGVIPVALACACGGTTHEDDPLPPYPETGCPPSHEIVNGVCAVKEVLFLGGTFLMGAGRCDRAGVFDNPPDRAECPLRDEPHSVTVEPFWVDVALHSQHDGLPPDPSCPSGDLSCGRDRYVPTRAGFGFVGTSPTGSTYDPKEAVQYLEDECARRGKRWLTEAEWEYIVTAGGTRKYPWGDAEPQCSNANLDFERCGNPNPSVPGLPELALIATYPPSSEGVYDLIGGFWEMLAPSPQAYSPQYTAVPLNLPECATGPGSCNWISKALVTAARGGDTTTKLDAVDPKRRHVTVSSAAFRCARPAD